MISIFFASLIQVGYVISRFLYKFESLVPHTLARSSYKVPVANYLLTYLISVGLLAWLFTCLRVFLIDCLLCCLLSWLLTWLRI